jgi:hypothetical protein
LVQSYEMQYKSENPLWGVTLGFLSQKISENSVTNTVKDFTKTIWLWKSGNKASDPQVCWQTNAGQWRGMYLKRNNGESDRPLNFRGMFLPVSLACKVLFCTYKFLRIFETLPDRNILYTYLHSALKALLRSHTEVRGTKKAKFCWPVLSTELSNVS